MCIRDQNLRLEELRIAFAQERCLIALDAHAGALAQPQHGPAMVADKLGDAFVARLALVLAIRLRFQIVRIDIERHQGQRLKAGRLLHGHIVGGVYGACGHIGAGTAAHIGEALLQHQFAYQLHQLQIVQLLQQHKRIAAAHEDGLCLAQRPHQIRFRVQTLDSIAPRLQCIAHRGRVLVMIPLGIRHKEHRFHVLAAKEAPAIA